MIPVDHDMSAERLSLISFTSSLGNSVSFTKEDGDLHPEARLLMSLSSSNKTYDVLMYKKSSSALPDVKNHDLRSEAQLLMNLFSSHGNAKNNASLPTKKSSFFFSCPSLSLEETNNSGKEMNGTHTLPCVSLSRPLTVYDADAVHLSANAMSSNILHTFKQAIEWRKQCWFEYIVASLVVEGQKMKACGKDEDEIKSTLLKRPESLVFACLNRSKIEVEEARISFRVLPRQWSKSNVEHKAKKQKIGSGRDNTYTKTYVLLMKVVLNFNLPSTSSEVTLEVPGIIDGFFSHGEKDLCGIAIDIDTKVLVNMVEKSTRMIVRSVVESEMSTANSNLATEVPPQSATITLQTTHEDSETVHATVSQTSSPIPKPVTISPTTSEGFCQYRDGIDKLEMPVLDDKERSSFLRAVSPELR